MPPRPIPISDHVGLRIGCHYEDGEEAELPSMLAELRRFASIQRIYSDRREV